MGRKHPALVKIFSFVVLAFVWMLVTDALSAVYLYALLAQVGIALVFNAVSVYVLDRHLNLA
jgi:hypothetical protein